MKEKLTPVAILTGLVALLAITVVVLLALLAGDGKQTDTTPETSGGIGTGINIDDCVGLSECSSGDTGMIPPPGKVETPKEVVTSGGKCVGLCLENDEATFLLPTSGILGAWNEGENDNIFVTTYTACDDIIVTDDRVAAIKAVCDVSDTLVYFDGDNDTYRTVVKNEEGKVRLIWGDPKPLPTVYHSEGSGGTLLK